MIHLMEEDSVSSLPHSFRSRRQIPMNPGKRNRSPEGSSLVDRPSKRPSLAVGGLSGFPAYRHLSLGSASSSRGTSEDWVQQAGGLSIDSPIFCPRDHDNRFASHDEVAEGGDVDMMDSEEGSVNERLERVQPGPLDTFHFPNTGPSQQTEQQAPALVPQTTLHHQYGTRLTNGLFANVDAPLLNLVSATPINGPQTPEEHASSVGRNSSELVYSAPQPSTPPPSSPVPMAISPTTSFSQIGSSKRRVVFGPRTNCDKCRLGAPGHFTHYE